MPPARENFREDILKLTTDNEGIARKDVRALLMCGEPQFKKMLGKMVAAKEIHIYTKHNADYLYTYAHAKANKIPARAKRTSPAYGKEKARLEGKVVVSGMDRAGAMARKGRRIVDSLWLPSRSGA